MKNSKAEELMKGFPELTEKLRKQMEQRIVSWIICDGKQAHCTSCKGTFPDKKDYYRHRKDRRCPLCKKKGYILRNYYNFDGSMLEAEDNFVVFQSSKNDDNLYVSCFNFQQYMFKGELRPRVTMTETQRYIYTDKQAFRYGRDKEYDEKELNGHKFYVSGLSDKWTTRSKLTEPRFMRQGYNAYEAVGYENLKTTCMRYSQLKDYPGKYLIEYLKFYQKHRGAERLIKSGFGELVKKSVSHTASSYYGYYNNSYYEKTDINWNENEVHKMLGITKDAVEPIRSGRIELKNYRIWRERYPDKPIDKLIEYNLLTGIHDTYDDLDTVLGLTGFSIDKLISYLKKSDITLNSAGLRDYRDYIYDCKKLRYDTRDKSINSPKNFYAAHERTTMLRAMIEDPGAYIAINGRDELEFESGELFIRAPKSKAEIIDEGNALSHCVGGYADRHAKGKLSIMFLRRKDKPDEPYYTVEVGNDLKIRQCRGYKNNVISVGGKEKPQEIKDFEEKYQNYLMQVYAKRAEEAKKSKAKRRKTA